MKTTWVNEIRKVLTTQLEACRGKKREKTNSTCSIMFYSAAQAHKLVTFLVSFRSQPAEGARPGVSVSPSAIWNSESQVRFYFSIQIFILLDCIFTLINRYLVFPAIFTHTALKVYSPNLFPTKSNLVGFFSFKLPNKNYI